MSITSPRPLVPFVSRDRLLTNENLLLLQSIVDALNGVKDENGFLFTIILGRRITVGTGDPDAVVVGDVGDVFIRTDGAAGTVLYIKEGDAGGDMNWAAK